LWRPHVCNPGNSGSNPPQNAPGRDRLETRCCHHSQRQPQPCIKIAENPINSERTKHIHVAYFFVRDRDQRNEIAVKCTSTSNMIADCLARNLERDKVQWCRRAMGSADTRGSVGRQHTGSYEEVVVACFELFLYFMHSTNTSCVVFTSFISCASCNTPTGYGPRCGEIPRSGCVPAGLLAVSREPADGRGGPVASTELAKCGMPTILPLLAGTPRVRLSHNPRTLAVSAVLVAGCAISTEAETQGVPWIGPWCASTPPAHSAHPAGPAMLAVSAVFFFVGRRCGRARHAVGLAAWCEGARSIRGPVWGSGLRWLWLGRW
jgi:hypothetical protein